MRRSKVLLLPFFCDGYDKSIAEEQVEAITELIEGLDIDVQASSLITNTKEAENAAAVYNPYNYDMAVLMPTTWSEPRLAAIAARQFFGKPIAIWCVDEFEMAGRRIEMSAAPAAAALHGCLQEMGVKSEMFIGLSSDEKRDERFIALSRAARAISMLGSAKLGFYGQNFNGITAADFDLAALRRKFGTEVYTFDGSELIRRMEAVDENSEEYKAAKQGLQKRLKGTTGEYFDKIIRMCVGLKDTIEEYDLSALDIRCHTEFSQGYGLSACIPLSYLGNFLPCSCEADLPVMLTQYILYALTGDTTAYVDLRTFHKTYMDVGACGYAPSDLTGNIIEVSGPEAPDNGNPAGYLTNKSGFNKGRITMARLIKLPEGKLSLHTVGATIDTIDKPLQEMGCPYYPMGKITPDCDMEQFLSVVGANHYALVYGEIIDALNYFCRYTDTDMI